MVSARRKKPQRDAARPRCTRSEAPSGDSVGRVTCCESRRAALGVQPERLRPPPRRSSTSPSRSRRPGRSRRGRGPSRRGRAGPPPGSSSATGPVAGPRLATTSTRTTGGWSKSTRSGAELEAVHRAPRPAAALGEAGRRRTATPVPSTPPRPAWPVPWSGYPSTAPTPRLRSSSRTPVKIRRARPCAAVRRQHHEAADRPRVRVGLEREGLGDLGQVVARARLHPADRCAVDVREVAVVDVAREEVVANVAVLVGRLGDVRVPRRHPPGHAPALAAVLVARHQREEVGLTVWRQPLESEVHRVSMGGYVG